MANGILVIDKSGGWTSHDVVAKLRGVFREKRAGHSGTLDPMATGVLPVFFGRATRAVEYASGEDKEYLAGLRLGLVTDTQDATGRVLEERLADVTPERLRETLAAFRGELLQTPPMYSAIKRGGKKLYELAREGKEVERTPRPVTIYSLELEEQTAPADFILRVVCSKGTYIRTLCHDIGAALSCGGMMLSLRRTRAGAFGLDGAVTMEEVLAHPDPCSLLRPADTLFAAYPAVSIDGRALALAKNGNDFPRDGGDGLYRVYGPTGDFLLLGRLERGRMRTMKSFYEV
jgi:tRNA pseudouridine55 synthase